MRVVILDADYPDQAIERDVLEPHGVDVVAPGAGSGDLAATVRDADVVVCQWARVDECIFAAAPRLGLVVRYGVGVDNIDLEAARARGIWVANVPGYGTEEVAAHAFATAMACVRHLLPFDRALRVGDWSYRGTGEVRRLRELTFGCLGLGAIGGMVAERAGAWFGHVIAHDPFGNSRLPGVQRVSLDELFEDADVLSLHVPLTEDTRHLVNAERIGQLPQGAVIINSARGGLIDDDALLEALDRGHVSAAGIDTWVEEPVSSHHPLVQHPAVLATPHVAWYSEESEAELRRRVALSILSWRQTGRPDHPVVDGNRTVLPEALTDERLF